ncbi:hypothetical protein, partial [Kitasatospora sp. NPDC059571]|uniref:hypothetical protein n=1 Tax=Kitasatospora sp. NPDC059571 TaxID=3346871 RepID=UPI003680083C
ATTPPVYPPRHRRETIQPAGAHLRAAAAELRAADRFRGTPLPVVNRHLRCAVGLLLLARTHLEAAAAVADGRPRTGAAR